MGCGTCDCCGRGGRGMCGVGRGVCRMGGGDRDVAGRDGAWGVVMVRGDVVVVRDGRACGRLAFGCKGYVSLN